MATGGNIKINLNGNENSHLAVEKKIAIESGGFMIAEAGSTVVDLVGVAMIDTLIPKPFMEYGSQILGKYVVEPFLDPIDTVTAKLCKLEECKVDKTELRETRAKHIGRNMMVFGAAGVLAIGSKLLMRRGWNEHFNIVENNPARLTLKDAGGVGKWIGHHARLDFMSPHEKMIFLADEGVHWTSMYLLNNQMAPVTDSIIRHTSHFLNKHAGLNEQKSQDVAKMFAIWELPNIVGAAAGIGVIGGAHAKGWPNGWAGKMLENKSRTDATHLEKLQKERLSHAEFLHTL